MITTQQKMNLNDSTTKLNDYLKNTSVVCTQKELMELIWEPLTHQTFPINEIKKINDNYDESETKIFCNTI